MSGYFSAKDLLNHILVPPLMQWIINQTIHRKLLIQYAPKLLPSIQPPFGRHGSSRIGIEVPGSMHQLAPLLTKNRGPQDASSYVTWVVSQIGR